MVAKMGPVRLRKLLEVFETPERILSAKRSELRAVEGIGNDVAEQIANWESAVDLSAELASIREFGAEVITAQSPDLPAPAARNSRAADRALRLGRTDGARSARHCCDRFAPHEPLRRGVREEAFLPTRVFRSHRHQWARAGHRHGGAPGRTGRERSHHRCDRLGPNETLSARKRRPRREDPQRKRRGGFRVFDGGRAGSPDLSDAQPNHQWLESRHSRSRGRVEQRRAYHRLAGDRAGPLGLCRSGSHQCPDRARFQPPYSARREAGHGCRRHSRRPPNSPSGKTKAARSLVPSASGIDRR